MAIDPIAASQLLPILPTPGQNSTLNTLNNFQANQEDANLVANAVAANTVAAANQTTAANRGVATNQTTAANRAATPVANRATTPATAPATTLGQTTTATNASPVQAQAAQNTPNNNFNASASSQQVAASLRSQALLEQASEVQAQAQALLTEAAALQAQATTVGSLVNVTV